jgi:hypothetical protein
MGDKIKSTLELALEKAEKIGKASKEELQLIELKEKAQKLSARFLKNEVEDFEKALTELLQGKNPSQRKEIIKSMVEVFLKNITLPWFEYQIDNSKKALEGLTFIFKNIPEISRLTQEIERILKEYYNHKEAIYNELKSRFEGGVEELEKNLSAQLGAEVKINIEEHPQFKEEWRKIKEKLDEEYERHLTYLKDLFRKIVS